jgi:large subunit ribosomal protein L25
MKLTVSSRDVMGKKVKGLRKEGVIPAVVYGKHLDQSLHISIEKLPLLRAYESAGMSTPVEIHGDGINQLVLFHRLQLNPVTDRLMHVEFLAVSKDEKVSAEVPLVLIGISPFEKSGEWRVQLVMQSVQVTAFPLDLPHDIQIDISVIEHEGQVLHISDLKVSDKIHIDEDAEAPILTALLNEVEKEDEEVVADAPAADAPPAAAA